MTETQLHQVFTGIALALRASAEALESVALPSTPEEVSSPSESEQSLSFYPASPTQENVVPMYTAAPTPPAEAPQTPPPAAPQAPQAPAVTAQDVINSFQTLCQKVGQQEGTNQVVGTLRSLGISKVSEANPEQLGVLYQKAQEALNAA